MKYIALPVTVGTVDYSTDEFFSVDGYHVRRSEVAGRQPARGETIAVFDVQQLADALHAGDDEFVEVELKGVVRAITKKAVVFTLSEGNVVTLPRKFVGPVELEDYVATVRIPRWLALDRGLDE